MNRDEAEKLMFEYTKSDALRKHMFAVEAAMCAYARKFGEEEDKWGVVLDGHKLIISRGSGIMEFYDLAEDAAEQRNLADFVPEPMPRLWCTLQDWMESSLE